MRIALTLGSALVALTLAASGCGGGDEGSAGDTTDTTTEPATTVDSLTGTVGPGFTISLTTADGGPLGTLAPGTVELNVEDLAPDHNFHLTGPGGVDVKTEVGGQGTSNFQVELQAGTYSFVCDPHASTMNGSFEVAG
jgi:Copper binding proteins, plastocyanin/azurin family